MIIGEGSRAADQVLHTDLQWRAQVAADLPECWHRSTLFMLCTRRGDPSLFTNYRPISLLSVMDLLFAIIILQ
jgi:hypothetical protein